jgi:hypothetical protein
MSGVTVYNSVVHRLLIAGSQLEMKNKSPSVHFRIVATVRYSGTVQYGWRGCSLVRTIGAKVRALAGGETRDASTATSFGFLSLNASFDRHK